MMASRLSRHFHLELLRRARRNRPLDVLRGFFPCCRHSDKPSCEPRTIERLEERLDTEKHRRDDGPSLLDNARETC